jgi:hypothetical protein
MPLKGSEGYIFLKDTSSFQDDSLGRKRKKERQREGASG